MTKIVFIALFLSLNLTLSSCNTVTGFSKGVIDDIRAVVPGI
jgi:predicted small secreted protein